MAPDPVTRSLPSLAWVVAAVAFASFCMTLQLPLEMTPPLDKAVPPEMIRALHMVDSTAQRKAHLVALAVLATATLIVRSITRGGRAGSLHFAPTDRLCGGVQTVGGAVLLVAMFWTTRHGPAGMSVAALCLGASLAFIGVGKRVLQTLESARGQSIVWGLVIIVLGCWLGAGFVFPPLLPRHFLFSGDWHYCATLSQGSRLAAGLPLFDLVQPHYGSLPIILQAAAERQWGLLDFGRAVRLVQISQVVFVLAALSALALWRPRRPLFLLVSVMVFVPWVGTLSPSVYYPNQSGWRFVGLPLGVLALVATRRAGIRIQLPVLAIVGAMLLLFNLETGIALCAGFVLYIAARSGSWRQLAGRLTVFALLVLATGIGIAGLSLAMLGPGIETEIGLDNLKYFSQFSGGYGGLPIYPDVLALIIFVHSMAIAAGRTIQYWNREGPADGSVEMGIAGVILVWFAYYWNRPDPWNLWTYSFLYMFLLARRLDCRVLARLGQGKLRAIWDLRFGLVFFVVVPHLVQVNLFHLQQVVATVRSAVKDARQVSGVRLDPHVAAIVEEKARFLRDQSPESSVVYVSHLSYLMSTLSGRQNPLPVQDVFAETLSNTEFNHLLARLAAMSPELIIFDDPQAVDVDESTRFGVWDHRAAFNRRLQQGLTAHYRPVETTSGWEVWARLSE